MFIIIIICLIQAGSRPGSGYKDGLLQSTTSNSDTDFIGNRNGESGTTRTPSINSIPNLPIDARGDAYLVNHYMSLPIDQRPYWILNQQHIEAQRGTPSRRPPADIPFAIGQNTFNSPNFPTRIDTDDVFNPEQKIVSTQNVGPQLSDVVYPSNITPEQQIDMEIQFLQQRLNGLIQIRNQLQQRKQNNPLERLR